MVRIATSSLPPIGIAQRFGHRREPDFGRYWRRQTLEAKKLFGHGRLANAETFAISAVPLFTIAGENG